MEPYQFQQPAPPPTQPPRDSIWKKLWVPFAALFVLLGKLKFVLIPILKFLPIILKTGGTMLISVGVYAMFYGWKYAAGFVLLIFIHECGHLVAAKRMGLNVGWPVFIPFMGAMIALKESPPSARIEAEVGIGGPYFGALGALGCLFLYSLYHNSLFLALAYAGFWLNLFNLIPILPLDGGRIVSAVSPWLWIVGIVLITIVAISFSFNIFLFFIVASSIPRVIAYFRHGDERNSEYYDLSAGQRIWMGVQYFGLAAALGYFMHSTHVQLQAIHS